MNRISGQQRLASKLGQPEAGHAWCTGFGRQPHQVGFDAMTPGRNRCEACQFEYGKHYRITHPRQDKRRYRYPRVPDETVSYPGNDGRLSIPAWGYPGENKRINTRAIHL